MMNHSIIERLKMRPKEYPFPEGLEELEYRLFPGELENDDHVFFRGVAASDLDPIIDNGFAIPATDPRSVSFSKNSSLALDYARSKRTTDSPCGCVLAVRYEELERPNLDISTSILHDYTCDPQPEIIGYCIVPASYIHI